MELLSFLPVITVGVVGVLLVIAVSVVLATNRNRVRPRQAWKTPEQSSNICCAWNRSSNEENNEERQNITYLRQQASLSDDTSNEEFSQSLSTDDEQNYEQTINTVTGEPSIEEKQFEEQKAEELIQQFNSRPFKKLASCILSNLCTYDSVEDFCENAVHPERMWISNSPKCDESDKLRNHFKQHRHKPIIYIGRVFEYTSSDRQGLKKLMIAGFTLKVWYNISIYIYPRYNIHIEKYIECTKKESDDCPHNEQDYYSEEQVSSIALGEIGVTHLLTNGGKLYRSTHCDTQGERHAEIVFIDCCNQQGVNIDDITQIWIKNSPCLECSVKLKMFFGSQAENTDIYVHVGHIFRPNNQGDFNGMVDLALNKFHFDIWETFNKDKYGRIHEETVSYLERVDTAYLKYKLSLK